MLDVRRQLEWDAGNREGGLVAAGSFQGLASGDYREGADLVHCKGGYRSLIACSLLQRAGFKTVTNVFGVRRVAGGEARW